MADHTDPAHLKVFISYSRRDSSAFANDLLVGLELLGFAPFLDRHDIAAGEDWEVRLANLIQSSDTVVFVISPEAVKSERCSWEIDKARAISKRIIPVVALPVVEDDVPQDLRQLNYIFFDKPHTFAQSLGELSKSLKTDLDWIREHTRLAELAQRWQQRDCIDALLLRGSELEAAKTWLAGWKAGAPDVTDTHRKFIAASEASEAARASRERQQLEDMAKAQLAKAEALAERETVVRTLSRRTAAGLVGAGVLTAASAGLAYWGVDAEHRFKLARREAEQAQERSIEAAIRRESSRTDIEGQLVAYAAAPGGVAMDGKPGENSPFTSAVLKALSAPNLDLQGALSRAARRVLADTNSQQRPYIATDMGGEIYMKMQPATRQRKALVFSVDQVETVSNKLVNAERDAISWETFLKEAGFDVQRLINPKKEQIAKALDDLKFDAPKKQGQLSNPLVHRVGLTPVAETPANTLALVFFSGYGVSIKGENYIAVADTKPSTEKDALETSFKLTTLQTNLRRKAAASVLVLDTNFTELFPATPSQPTR